MDSVTLDYLKSVSSRLKTAPHGQKSAIVEQSAKFLNCSVKQVYTMLKQANLAPQTKKGGRKIRTDKGKTVITESQAKLIGGMILVATRNNGKRILSVKDATEILKAQGKLPDVDVSTILRALKMYHCHPDQLATPTAHTSVRSLHPNHLWQIDASVCVLFYLPKGGMRVMDEKEFYKNKPKNLEKVAKERVIRYVITNHYSGAMYVEYVQGAESSENLTRVFMDAILKRNADDPMHGVPLLLGLDKGSANMSGLFLNFLDRLSVKYIPHATGNSRAKGQVEQAQNLVETKFESRLAFLKVNALATKWRIDFNARHIHTRHRKTRNSVWLTITNDQLRVAPSRELCQELVTTRPKTVQVRGDLTVTHTVKGFANQAYDLTHIDGIYPKAQVDIVVNPYRVPNIDVAWQGQIYTVAPIDKDTAGFDVNAPVIGQNIVAKPQAVGEYNRRSMLKQAYNANTNEQVDKARKARAVAYDGQIDIMADIADSQSLYLTKKGVELDIKNSGHLIGKKVLKSLSPVEIAKTIKSQLGHKWQADFYQVIVNTYPNGASIDEIDSIAKMLLQNNQKDKPSDMLLRAVG